MFAWFSWVQKSVDNLFETKNVSAIAPAETTYDWSWINESEANKGLVTF